MTSVATVKKEVEKLRQRTALKPKRTICVVFSFGPHSEPHGKYGYRRVNVHTGESEAVEEAQEVKYLLESYQSIQPEARERNWPTFEEYAKSRECKCGQHR